jgi:hypothetical protein
MTNRPALEEGFRQLLTVSSESDADDLALALATLADSTDAEQSASATEQCPCQPTATDHTVLKQNQP